MKLILTPDGHNVEFVPESNAEETIITMFPALYKVRGKRFAPSLPHILQNIIERLKKTLKTPITTSDKKIVDLLKNAVTLRELPEDFNFITEPMSHQRIVLQYLLTNGGGGVLLDPGLGKTKIILDFIKMMRFKKSLIVCPVALLDVWVDETETHRPDLKTYVLQSTSWPILFKAAKARVEKHAAALEQEEEGSDEYKKIRTKLRAAEREVKFIPAAMAEDLELAAAADVVVINYDKASNLEYLQKHFAFDFIALDEALIKTHNSARTLALLKLGVKIPHRVIMSGTLINNTALDAFAPIRFLQPALTGMAYGKFDQHYGIKIKPRGKTFEVTIGVSKKNVQEIRGILEACSIVMRKEDWLDLPPKHFHRVDVELTEAQKRMYSGLVSNYTYELPNGELVSVDNGLGMLAKVQQIASGFLYYREESDDYFDILFGNDQKESPRQTYLFEENPKLDALFELLNGPVAGRKFILWYNCEAEYELITAAFRERSVTHRVIKGGTKGTGGIIREFNNDPSITALVCQAKSVNYGITVLGANPENLDKAQEILPEVSTKVFTHIFYSLNYSLEVYLQQQDRSHRIGQTLPVDYYVLLGRCDAEEQVFNALQNKMVIRESTLVDFSRRLKPLV